MVKTAKHLMTCGFNVVYAYTQSVEISLLLNQSEQLFGRKTRKYISILAGEASAQFSCLLGPGGVAAFDCRLSELPNAELVVDYFRWRHEDASRNALNAHCYWMERKKGLSQQEATQFFSNQTVAFKNEHLFQNGINYNDLPSWQKRGVGLYWEQIEKPVDGASNTTDAVLMRCVKIEENLPVGNDYSSFIKQLLIEAQ